MVDSKNLTNLDSTSGLGSTSDIEHLIAALADSHRDRRHLARESLVEIGEPAVAPLIEALTDPNCHVRWEAAKALGEIGDPTAAKALITCLEDDLLEVRWRAAEDLISFGRQGLIPLLRALINRSESVKLREGAHHALRSLSIGGLREIVTPVIAALEGVEPALTVPQAAHTALEALAA